MLRSLSLLAATLALTAACGRHHVAPSSPPPTSSAPAELASPSSASSTAGSAELEAPSRSPAAQRSAAADEAAPSYESKASPSRPGLGTEWGESRTSRVSSAPFERDGHQPRDRVSLFYNDAEGLQAMTRGSAPSAIATTGAAIRGGLLSVRLLDASGSTLPTYISDGRTYVLGEDGERYVIQIQNHTGARFEAVATVDGLDVIDGRPGSLDKRGYLIAPWATLEIEGFRRSLDDVASFRFGSVANSYAARTTGARNVGVIGVAFFAEAGQGSVLLDREADRRHAADPFPGGFAEPPR